MRPSRRRLSQRLVRRSACWIGRGPVRPIRNAVRTGPTQTVRAIGGYAGRALSRATRIFFVRVQGSVTEVPWRMQRMDVGAGREVRPSHSSAMARACNDALGQKTRLNATRLLRHCTRVQNVQRQGRGNAPTRLRSDSRTGIPARPVLCDTLNSLHVTCPRHMNPGHECQFVWQCPVTKEQKDPLFVLRRTV